MSKSLFVRFIEQQCDKYADIERKYAEMTAEDPKRPWYAHDVAGLLRNQDGVFMRRPASFRYLPADEC